MESSAVWPFGERRLLRGEAHECRVSPDRRMRRKRQRKENGCRKKQLIRFQPIPSRTQSTMSDRGQARPASYALMREADRKSPPRRQTCASGETARLGVCRRRRPGRECPSGVAAGIRVQAHSPLVDGEGLRFWLGQRTGIQANTRRASVAVDSGQRKPGRRGFISC